MIFSSDEATQKLTLAAATPGSVTVGVKSPAVLLTNSGSDTAFVRVGQGTFNAAVDVDIPVLAGTQIILSKKDANKISAYSTAGTTLFITPGTMQ